MFPSTLISKKLVEKLTLVIIYALVWSLIAPVAYSRQAFKINDDQSISPLATEKISVRLVDLQAKDVVYDKVSKKLYASVPSSVSLRGNSITPIEPTTGAVGSSYFIGSEPSKLAVSDDGQALYVSLDGASAIRRFDIPTLTAGQQFSIGSDSFSGRYSAADLAVAPGNPNLVAVARNYPSVSPPEAGVAVFDNGVQRPKTGPGHSDGNDYLAFSASPSILYGSGYYSSLTTMTIDASGVTVSGRANFSSGSKIKFDGGLIFNGSGQVINPDTATLLGTFSGAGSNAFVPDTTVGRAYYVTGGQYNGGLTLKAFDINTFLPVGSVAIQGVTGDPVTLVRWGANGLALRTSSNQLALIQTTLIPSSEPVPDPTPTPSPTPSPSPATFDTFARVLPLQTNDLVYNRTNQQLYASVPSSAGSIGNSITSIDPQSGSVGNSFFIGSEPKRLALSDDGATLYTALTGSGAVRRFDIASQTAGLQFSLGNTSFDGPANATDLAVVPGNPSSVAVSKGQGTTTIYDDGTPRPQSGSSGSLAFGSANTLYVGNGSIQKYVVDSTGLTSPESFTSGSYGNIVYDHGLIYMSGGAVIDPSAKTLKGTFTNGQGSFYGAQMAVDYANGRVFFLGTSNTGSGYAITAFDINTFLPLGSISLSGISNGLDSPTSLVRWGVNGLAFRTSNRVYLIQTTLVNSSQAVPAATPTPSPTPSPSPEYIPAFTRKISLPTNDLIYNQATQKLYASVPSSAGSNGNSITSIDPAAGSITKSVFVGSEPNRLAASDDGQTLYVTLDGANAVRRFDMATQTPGLQFQPQSGFQRPSDMAVMPGNPHALAIAGGYNGTAIYDDGVQRPSTTNGGAYSTDRIAFGATPSTLYGYDNQSSGFELVKMAVDSTGVKSVNLIRQLVTGYGVSIKYVDGLLYSSSGRVVDPEAQKLLGTFQDSGYSYAVDSALNRIFFISGGGGGSSVRISAFDIRTYLPLGVITIPNVSGNPFSLVRWGVNGLAFRTTTSFGSTNTDNSIYLVQTNLVSAAAPVPTGVQFDLSNYYAYEGSGIITVKVLRTGDISGTTTVDYATSDGTATQRSSYTAASGTLTFAPGETSKTFDVLLIDNAYQDGSRTINLTLSNPGGAVVSTTSPSVITIQDNDYGTPSYNPIDQSDYFVRQQYSDFLNRAPDQGGLAYWSGEIFKCGSNAQCIHDRRVGVSDAFFFEPEYQQTGGYIYRIYKAGLGMKPTYAQFMADRGYVVSGPGLDQSKTAYALNFVKRDSFLASYPRSQQADQFVDALLSSIKQKSGVDLSSQRSTFIGLYDGTDNGRAAILRQIADNQSFIDAEYNSSFVLMEYFGYMRRDPDQGGYDFWLAQVNRYPLRDVGIQHAMACSFITSEEYQTRFSSVVTHTNRECPQ